MLKKILVWSVMMACTFMARGQVANNTQLVGTVTDSSGGVIAGARVIGTNVDTRVQYPGTTNAEGYYAIPYILPGTYNVTVEMQGFTRSLTKGVIVPINISVRTDAVLQVGSMSTEITVTADNPPLSTDDALLGETIEAERVHDLPLNQRNPLDLAATTSNIVLSGSARTGVPPGERASGAGTRPSENEITMDGISIMNNLGSYASFVPSPDAIESVQTQNGNYTAQYGDYLGVHIDMSTKAGGNKFHGTVFDYLQNDAFNSHGFIACAPTGTCHVPAKPHVRFNNFGAEVSGPIWKDKAFFMGSYEGIRQNNTTATSGQVISSLERSGDFSQISGGCPTPTTCATQLHYPNSTTPIPNDNFAGTGLTFNPISVAIANQYLTPDNNFSPSTVASNFSGNNAATLSQDSTIDRVDYHVNDKIQIFGRFAWQKLTSFSGDINPANGSGDPTHVRNAVFGYTHILTPHLVNDFRAGFNVIQTNALNFFTVNGVSGAGTALGIPGFTSDTQTGNQGLPSFSISGGYSSLTGSDGTNWYQDDRTLMLYDQIAYTRNKHAFLAGVSFRRLSIGRAATNQPRGSFTFNGQYTGDAAADFLLGLMQTDNTPAVQVKGETGQYRDGFFVQDTWQAKKNLTLQFGLRYELPQVAYSLNGVGRILTPDLTALFPAQGGTNSANAQAFPGFKYTNPNHSNFAPRFGLSYRLTDKTVVRAGGGIYYNANHLNAYTLSSGNYPYAAVQSFPNTTTTGVTPTQNLSNPTPGSGSASPVAGTPGTYVNQFTVDRDLPTERMYQWNVDIGREVWKNGGAEIQYLGSRSIHLDNSFYPNAPPPTPGVAPSTVNARRPFQNFGSIREVKNDGFATYNGLNVILRQRVTHGLSATVAYTWSHALDTSQDLNGGGSGSAMYQGHLKLDYGNSDYDIRHRFVATFTYALPTFAGYNHLVQETIGGWQVNGIVDLHTGAPMNVNISSDVASTGEPGSPVRPVFVHRPQTHCNKSFYWANGLTTAHCIDSTAYAMPAQGTFGNVHRNDIYGPNQVAQNSLSLFKNFKIYHDVFFQFRAEAFNLMNHANLTLPSGNLVVSGSLPALNAPIQPIPNTPGAITLNGAFGEMGVNTTAPAVSNRTIQFAGKVNF